MWGKILAFGVVALVGVALFLLGASEYKNESGTKSGPSVSMGSFNTRTANFGRINF